MDKLDTCKLEGTGKYILLKMTDLESDAVTYLIRGGTRFLMHKHIFEEVSLQLEKTHLGATLEVEGGGFATFAGKEIKFGGESQKYGKVTKGGVVRQIAEVAYPNYVVVVE